jgi:SAM-dependent methyltransferase
MDISGPLRQIRADLEGIRSRRDIYQESSFVERARALDAIERHVADRIAGLPSEDSPPELAALLRRSERVRRELEAIDGRLFARLRDRIRATGGADGVLARAIAECLGETTGGRAGGDGPGYDYPGYDYLGYDYLDAFADRLLLTRPAPREHDVGQPEMVPYLPTPARVVLDMVARGRLTSSDVFYDLGSGLGQVTILVHLLSGATAIGIEYQPRYCTYAQVCAADLGLAGVHFVNADVRAIDLSDGDVFFLYSPFEGQMLHDVLARLRAVSLGRPIRVFAYGPCSEALSRQPWLERTDGAGGESDLWGFSAPRERVTAGDAT